ncbi:MAG: hemerythrin domain-containing protein [Flavisolibacter sp.]
MKLETNPIKRSHQLAPLSREHHQVLLFVWKIKQGLKYNVNTETIASYCNWFWETHLKSHFKEEEISLTKILASDHPMMMKMLDDHRAIESKINQLSECATVVGLKRLAQIITYHIRYEERELFNYIEQIASPGQLDEIFQPNSIIEKEYQEWDNHFWVKSS